MIFCLSLFRYLLFFPGGGEGSLQDGLSALKNCFISRGDWTIISAMAKYRYTAYFENEVLRKRPL
jgi:hypothetical protein